MFAEGFALLFLCDADRDVFELSKILLVVDFDQDKWVVLVRQLMTIYFAKLIKTKLANIMRNETLPNSAKYIVQISRIVLEMRAITERDLTFSPTSYR